MQKYNCKNCGAELYWDSNANCLKCEYCENEYQVSDFETPEPSQVKKEPERAEKHASATDDSESIELVVYKCSHCGAEIVTAKSTVATTCAYCGRAIAMTEKMVENFKPDVVIPFSVDEEKAQSLYKDYIHSSFLTPKDFGKESTIKKMKGVYVPFWLHSFAINTNAVVYGENITSSRHGDDKIVNHHMYHVHIDAKGSFSNIPTDALKNLDNTLMDALEPFDYNHLKEFNPAYMAGFYAEEYNENESQTITRALSRAQQAMNCEIEREAGVYAIKRIQSSNETLSNKDSKYAMLPVWLLNVEYKGQDYLFAINGETGKITGKLPICKKKLALIALAIVFGGCLAIFLLSLTGGVL